MKQFGKLLLWFLIPVFITAISIELLERNIPNSYQLKDNNLKASASQIKTLILGDSHSYYDINPKYLTEKAFNFGEVSQSVDIDNQILKTYIDQLPNLKNVIVRLSYTTLFEQLKHTSEAWRTKDYEIYTDVNLNNNKLKYHSEILTMKLKYNLKDIYEYYFKNENLLNTDPSGWGNDLDGEIEKDKNEIGKIIAKKHTIKNKKYFEENLKCFKSIIDICKKRNINVILVTLPAHSAYIEHLDDEQLDRSIQTGKALAKNHENCRYYNFLKSERFQSGEFYDVDHMNKKGAKKMSIILNNILENKFSLN